MILHSRFLFPVLGLLFLGGCAGSPEDQMVGVYSLDPVRTQVPEFAGAPQLETRIRQVTRNFRLKLLSDRRFVLILREPVEGTWKRVEDKITLVPEKASELDLLKSSQGNIDLRVAKDFPGLYLDRETPVGNIRLVLRKTG